MVNLFYVQSRHNVVANRNKYVIKFTAKIHMNLVFEINGNFVVPIISYSIVLYCVICGYFGFFVIFISHNFMMSPVLDLI